MVMLLDRRFIFGLLVGLSAAFLAGLVVSAGSAGDPSVLLVLTAPALLALWSFALARNRLRAAILAWFGFWGLVVTARLLQMLWFQPWVEALPWSPVLQVVLPMVLLGAAALWGLSRVVVITPPPARTIWGGRLRGGGAVS
jgi:hypothetical protein